MSGHWTLESPGHWHQRHESSPQWSLVRRAGLSQDPVPKLVACDRVSSLCGWVESVLQLVTSDIMMKWVSSPNLHVQAGHQGGHGQPGQCPCVLCQFSQPHTASCAQENGD